MPAILAEATDTSFAVLHGLYWLTANLANQQPLLMAVDDAHWADEPSLRWLAHLAPRLGELAVTLMVALRSVEPAPSGASLAALRAEASRTLRPGLLSEGSVDALVRSALGHGASDQLRAAVWEASGGNPLYVSELLRAIDLEDPRLPGSDPAALMASGAAGITQRVLAALPPRSSR